MRYRHYFLLKNVHVKMVHVKMVAEMIPQYTEEVVLAVIGKEGLGIQVVSY